MTYKLNDRAYLPKSSFHRRGVSGSYSAVSMLSEQEFLNGLRTEVAVFTLTSLLFSKPELLYSLRYDPVTLEFNNALYNKAQTIIDARILALQ